MMGMMGGMGSNPLGGMVGGGLPGMGNINSIIPHLENLQQMDQ